MIGGTTVGTIFVRVGADASGLVTGFQKATREIERFGSRVFFMGSRMTAGITMPIMVAAGAVGKFGVEFDKAMTESLAIMDGVTPKIRKDMEEVARSISESSKYSAKEAAEGFYHLASAGYSATEAMQLLPVTTRFAQAGVMDLAKATEYLAGAQQSLGMRMEDPIENAKEMTRISDVLTEANNRALGTIEDFAQAITNKAGAQLRIYNKTVEEGTAALMALASQNVKGRLAGQQLYMVMRDLARFSLANADAWKKYGISVYDAVGNMRNLGDIITDVDKAMNKMSVVEQTKMWKALGFTDRTRAAIQYFRGMGQEMHNYENALNNAAGATERVANNQMKAFANQMQVVWNKIKNVAIELFNAFAPTLLNIVIPAVERLIERFAKFAKWVSTWSDQTKVLTLIFLGLAAAMGPIITVMGSQILFLSAIVGGFTALGTSIRFITGLVVTATKAWNDYAKAQGAVTLAQSFAWASGAVPGAATSKAVSTTGAKVATGAAAAAALGPGARQTISAGLLAYRQEELAARQAAAAIAGLSAAQIASMKMMATNAPEVTRKMGELTRAAVASSAATTNAVASGAKNVGVLNSIVTHSLNLLGKVPMGIGLFVRGILGPFAAIATGVRLFSDSWSEAFMVIWNVTMKIPNQVIGILRSLQKQMEPVIDLLFGDDTVSDMKRAVGTWDEWKTAASDLGTVSWNWINDLIKQFNKLAEEERNAYYYIPLISDALKALSKLTFGTDLKNEIKNALFPGVGFMQAAWELIKHQTGAKSVPDLLSLMTYSGEEGQARVDESERAARAAFEKQMGELYGASSGMPYVGFPGTNLPGRPYTPSASVISGPAPERMFTPGYLGPAYEAMGGTGGMTGQISGLPQMLSGFEKVGKLPEFMKEVQKVWYRLAKAPPEERQKATMEVIERYQAQMKEGAFPEGLQKPTRPEPVDRNLSSQRDYFSRYTEGQSNDLKNMAAAATNAAIMFFDAFPDATEIPLQWSERMWEDYKKFKDELSPGEITGNIKVLDDLTAVFWKQEVAAKEMAAALPHGWWGTMAEDITGVDKKVNALVASFDELGLNSLAQVQALNPEFFQDNAEAISELAVKWQDYPAAFKAMYPEVDALIERFYALNKSGAIVSNKMKEYTDSLSTEIAQMSDDATAKLADLQQQLETQLGGQFSGKEMRFLKETWSKQLEDIDKKYWQTMRKIAATPIGPTREAQIQEWLFILNGWRDTMLKVVETNIKVFRGNWAEAMGFTPRQVRRIVQMEIKIVPNIQGAVKLSPGIEGNKMPDLSGIFGKVSPGIEGDKNFWEGYTIKEEEFEKLQKFANEWKKITEAINEALTLMSRLGDLLRNLGLEVAADIISAAVTAAQEMWQMMTEFAKALKTHDYVGMISAGIGAAGAFAKALQAPTRGQRAAGGAASGAMAGAAIGTMIMPGIGTAIGAGIGGFAGFIAGIAKKDPGWKQIMGRVGNDYGMAFKAGFEGISEDLAKAIEADAKKLFGGDWQAAEIFNMSKIMEETGGVDTTNLDAWTDKLNDVFVMLKTGKFTVEQAGQAFDSAFAQISQAVIDSERIASPAFLLMIQRAREFGIESKALADFISGQFTRAMTAWAALVSPLAKWSTEAATARQELTDFNAEMEKSGKYDPKTGKYKDLGVEDQKTLDEINKKLKGVKFTVADVTKEFEAFNAEMEKSGKYDPKTGTYTGLGVGDQKRLDELNAKMKEAKESTADASKEAERLGRLLMAAFNGAVKSGMDFFAVMDAMGPNLDTLIQLYKDLGITSDNAALNSLMHYRELYNKNKELVDGVRALNEMTLALSNLGALSAESLADLEAQGLAMYDQMIEAGFTEQETLMAMLPWLRNVFDAHVKLGIPIDENTQKLIDQANKLGLLEDNDPTSILKQGFKDLIQAVKDLTDALLGIPKRVDSDVNVNYHYNDPGRPGGPDGGGKDGEPDPNPQAFGGSYWVTQPTMFVAGEAGPEYAMFSGANQSFSAADIPGGRGGGTVVINIDRRKLAELLVPEIPGIVREYGLGR